MTDYTDLAKRYLAAFNEPDEAARAAAVADLFTADATYVDPLAEVSGHDGIAGFLAAAREQLPGFEFRLDGAVDGHHRQARFRWVAGPAEVLDGAGAPPVVGFDVVVTDDSGRIRSVYGFLDAVPA
ncbi:SnoaL-like domain-containing protein [Pseudonocardia thermophila]|jgi:hypothetical protein|uniref:SnoaL-like domain-containing protein n=1 Tax=Pseudonocardia thermophila TaxID=1848 RepID=A0A1M7ANU4_PSETH|nr:nuclear transport factor 2 family protein [Pseudonocardia thermophila]SHL44411.1 SnoaL-like domain-containing protein [Pseudonocardia thermophila]